jgi:hypothetical protein
LRGGRKNVPTSFWFNKRQKVVFTFNSKLQFIYLLSSDRSGLGEKSRRREVQTYCFAIAEAEGRFRAPHKSGKTVSAACGRYFSS